MVQVRWLDGRLSWCRFESRRDPSRGYLERPIEKCGGSLPGTMLAGHQLWRGLLSAIKVSLSSQLRPEETPPLEPCAAFVPSRSNNEYVAAPAAEAKEEQDLTTVEVAIATSGMAVLHFAFPCLPHLQLRPPQGCEHTTDDGAQRWSSLRKANADAPMPTASLVPRRDIPTPSRCSGSYCTLRVLPGTVISRVAPLRKVSS